MNQLNPGEFADVEGAIRAATDAILAQQRPDGHWVYELEADATIPAEYVLLVHYLAETPNLELERKIGVYLRRIQGAHGGWPLYHEGAFDISATVKAYFALKMIGDDIDAPHMARAREEMQQARRRHQGQCLHPHPAGAVWPDQLVERAHRAAGTDPAAALVSHSSVQDELLGAHRDRAAAGAVRANSRWRRNPRGIHIAELFVPGVPRRQSPRAPHQSAGWSAFFAALDRVLKRRALAEGLRANAPSRNAAPGPPNG